MLSLGILSMWKEVPLHDSIYIISNVGHKNKIVYINKLLGFIIIKQTIKKKQVIFKCLIFFQTPYLGPTP